MFSLVISYFLTFLIFPNKFENKWKKQKLFVYFM